jgi:hypothetical protein
MNSIENGLGMRETKSARKPSRPWNPHFYAILRKFITRSRVTTCHVRTAGGIERRVGPPLPELLVLRGSRS